MIQVVIFGFNRPKHLQNLIESLSLNKEARQTPITIYLDGAKNSRDLELIKKCVLILKKYEEKFKDVTTILRKKNYGSAKNISLGITEQFKNHKSLIILEDDLLVSKIFLLFMNQALTRYSKTKEIYHISGYSYFSDPSDTIKCYTSPIMNCWGWGTWFDRWEKFDDTSAEVYINELKTSKYEFNVNGSHDYYKQIEDNKEGVSKTWAIFWYVAIFRNSGRAIFPTNPLCINCGNDGQGERYGNSTSTIDKKKLKHTFKHIEWPISTEVDQNYYLKQVEYFNSQKNFFVENIKKFIYISVPKKYQNKVIYFFNRIRMHFLNFFRKTDT